MAEAESQKRAIGHFNTSNIEGFWAIVRAAKELSASWRMPVIVGVSEGERDFIGVKQIAAIVKTYREETGQPVFLNADHTYTFDRVREAIDAGFDAVIFDGAKLSLEENIKITKQGVDYARACGRDVLVEGELGYIGASSKVLTEVPVGVALGPENLTKPEEADQFVAETGVDLLAPAVGNIHGMLAGQPDPKLDIERVKQLAGAVKSSARPNFGGLVLHGASGNTDKEIKTAIEAGMRIVHVNTELRVAFRDALKLSLQENPDEVAPYKIMRGVVTAVQKVVEKKLQLFSNL